MIAFVTHCFWTGERFLDRGGCCLLGLRYAGEGAGVAPEGFELGGPANGRFHKIMYYLNIAERNGNNPTRILREALRPGTLPEFYYDRSLVERNLLDSYTTLKGSESLIHPKTCDV